MTSDGIDRLLCAPGEAAKSFREAWDVCLQLSADERGGLYVDESVRTKAADKLVAAYARAMAVAQ